MAKKITFNSKQVSVAEHGESLLFNRTELAAALDYKGTIEVTEGSVPFVLGAIHFYELAAMQPALNKMKGDRKPLVAGFIREVYEQFPNQLTNDGKHIASLDDLAQAWVVARIELNTATTILNEARVTEQDLFNQLNEERTNDQS